MNAALALLAIIAAAAIEQLHVLMRQLAPVMEAAGLTQAPAGKRSR